MLDAMCPRRTADLIQRIALQIRIQDSAGFAKTSGLPKSGGSFGCEGCGWVGSWVDGLTSQHPRRAHRRSAAREAPCRYRQKGQESFGFSSRSEVQSWVDNIAKLMAGRSEEIPTNSDLSTSGAGSTREQLRDEVDQTHTAL